MFAIYLNNKILPHTLAESEEQTLEKFGCTKPMFEQLYLRDGYKIEEVTVVIKSKNEKIQWGID